MNIPLEAYVTSSFVKYERLAPIIAEAFVGYDDTYLDIYIDMNSVIRSLYNSNFNTSITNYKSLAACMVNMCAHYRDYFRKYLGVNTDIIIVMSDNCYIMNRKMVAEYNKTSLYKIKSNTLITNMIEDNMNALNLLVPYLPNIYMVQSEFETSGVISAIIEKRLELNRPSLIISRDVLNMQILSLYNRTAVLRPMKTLNNGDTSYIVGPLSDQKSIINYWSYLNSEISESKTLTNIIHPINTSLLMAMCGYDKRDLSTIINIRSARKYIYNCVQDNPVHCSVKTLFEMNDKLNEKTSWTTISSRQKVLDVIFQQAMYKESIEYKLLNFTDLYDPAMVKRINDKLFYDDPIDLDRL